jgi:hypothetical protein
VVAGARFVVSENTTDFPPTVAEHDPSSGRAVLHHVYGGIAYLTAIEFIEDVLGEDAAQIHGADLPRVLTRSGRSQHRLPS